MNRGNGPDLAALLVRHQITCDDSMGADAPADCSEVTTRLFNRYLYENIRANLESQVESWNRNAVRSPNPEIAHALWLKAEGLGYAVRLLYAFEPEFRELVECASSHAGFNDEVCTSKDLERKLP